MKEKSGEEKPSGEKQDEKKTVDDKQSEEKKSPKKESAKENEGKKPPAKKKPKKKVIETPEEQYVVSSSPHMFGKDSVSKIMWTVSACLAPAGLAGIYIFGIRVLAIILVSILGAVAAEYAWQKITGKPVTIKDGSAFLTGLLIAYNLSPSIPLWLPLVGSFFAIIIVKQLFGGLGFNIFNPALAARGFLLASWPQQMTTWWQPRYWQPAKSLMAWDGITKATPLFLMKDLMNDGKVQGFKEFIARFPTIGKFVWALLWGNRGGCLGETCAILLVLGGLYLIYKKYIDWQVPVAFIGTVAVLLPIFYSLGKNANIMDIPMTVIFSTLTGGLILGAFYMATDYVTTPSTVRGRVIFAIGCGVLTSIIRRWGGLPEGVCYSILIMNAFTPLIDAKVRTKVYGIFKKKEKPA
ncbi:MAG: RnfABCDGE type electron transport complex subunit D [Candidatus Eremiobacteraeota bacterium]|nr:RnfABCDGE type electron transport complex subunit D [Candidatus Eremiobacteraeota bacterium]